jgi:hypothetical protein
MKTKNTIIDIQKVFMNNNSCPFKIPIHVFGNKDSMILKRSDPIYNDTCGL